MRQGDMPPPVPDRVANPRVPEDRAVQDFQYNSEKDAPCHLRRRPTQEHGFDYCRSVFPQSRRGRQAQTLTFTTCQRTNAASSSTTWVPSTGRVNFRKAENMDKPISSNGRVDITNDPQQSHLRELCGTIYAHVILTAKADILPTDEKELLDDYGLVGCHSSRSNGPVSPRMN